METELLAASPGEVPWTGRIDLAGPI